jgi:methyl-accepting chemotaxis protein
MSNNPSGFLSDEAREALEKSFDPVKQQKFIDQMQDAVESVKNMHRSAPPNFVPVVDSNPSLAESLQGIVDAFNEQNDILRTQVETLREASKQSEAVAREANAIARGANTRATFAIGATILCAVISSASLVSVIVFWVSFFSK